MKQYVFCGLLTFLGACGSLQNDKQTSVKENPDNSSLNLAGKSFCRSVTSDGSFGQVAGERQHCITFSDKNQVTDDGSTFFGNAPEQGTYSAENNSKITLTLKSVTEETYKLIYTLSEDGKILTGESHVLNLKE